MFIIFAPEVFPFQNISIKLQMMDIKGQKKMTDYDFERKPLLRIQHKMPAIWLHVHLEGFMIQSELS